MQASEQPSISENESKYMWKLVRESNHKIVLDDTPHDLRNFLWIQIECNEIEETIRLLKLANHHGEE